MAKKEPKKYYLSKEDKKILGVCGGFAAYFNVDVTMVRIVWLMLAIFSAGLGILAYIAVAVIAPEEP